MIRPFPGSQGLPRRLWRAGTQAAGVSGTFWAVGQLGSGAVSGSGSAWASPEDGCRPGVKYVGGIIQKCIAAFQRHRSPRACRERKGCSWHKLPPSHHPKPLGFRFGKKKKTSQICHLGKQLLTAACPALLKIQDVGSVPSLRRRGEQPAPGPWQRLAPQINPGPQRPRPGTRPRPHGPLSTACRKPAPSNPGESPGDPAIGGWPVPLSPAHPEAGQPLLKPPRSLAGSLPIASVIC